MLYDKEIIETIKNKLLEKKCTIAVAESVTSGHLQAALSTAIDASKFFQGGITAYNIGQKCRHLTIEPTHALECDCVSDIIAESMALNICTMFLSNVGVGITGYASPIPEQGVTDLYAWFSIAFNGAILLTKKIAYTNKDSFIVQVFYANKVLEELAAALP
jgi:PncC family amidohydrolase